MYKMDALSFAVLAAILCSLTTAACPTNCTSGQICNASDSGCLKCEPAYYGRQCQHRIQCRYTEKGAEYRGTRNTTENGRTCQRWASDIPHEHNRNTEEENFCRNYEENNDVKPWCFTIDPNVRWEYCDIPMCDIQCQAPNLDAPYADITNTPPDGFTVGFTANIQVSCASGYETQGMATTTCQSDKTWLSTTLPTCEKIQCKSPTLSDNIKIGNGKAKYEYQDKITIVCNSGYTLEGYNVITCQSDKTWSPIYAACKKIQCQSPIVPSNSKIKNEEGKYEYQDKITFVCNNGYTLDGKNEKTCQADKTWSSASGTCISLCPTHCRPLQICGSDDNGCLECDQGYYGRQCQHRIQCRYTEKGAEYRGTKNTTENGTTCQRWASDTPHEHVRNTEEENFCRNYEEYADVKPWCFTIDPNVRWEYCDIPMCDTQCPAPNLDVPYTDIANPPPDGFAIGFTAIIQAACDNGYETKGVATTTCGSHKRWSSTTLPTCTKIQCQSPTLPDNSKIRNKKEKYGYHDNVTIVCNTGYTLQGNNEMTCQSDKTWSSTSVTCNKIQCEYPTLPKNSTLEKKKDKYEYQDNITFVCNKGYTLIGKNEMTCQSNKTWTLASGSCEILECPRPCLTATTFVSNPKTESFDGYSKEQMAGITIGVSSAASVLSVIISVFLMRRFHQKEKKKQRNYKTQNKNTEHMNEAFDYDEIDTERKDEPHLYSTLQE